MLTLRFHLIVITRTWRQFFFFTLSIVLHLANGKRTFRNCFSFFFVWRTIVLPHILIETNYFRYFQLFLEDRHYVFILSTLCIKWYASCGHMHITHITQNDIKIGKHSFQNNKNLWISMAIRTHTMYEVYGRTFFVNNANDDIEWIWCIEKKTEQNVGIIGKYEENPLLLNKIDWLFMNRTK